MAVSLPLMIAAIVVLFLSALRKHVWHSLKWYIRACNSLRKINGPLAIPIFGSTWQFKLDRIDFSYQLQELTAKHGSEGMMKMWIGETNPIVVLTRWDTAEPILSSNTHIVKSGDYNILRPWLGDGLLLSSGAKWRQRRKQLTPTFHFSILQSFVEIYNEQSKIMVECLQNQVVGTDQTFDAFPYIKRCALDIICATAMGVTANSQRDTNSPYVIAVQDINDIAFKHQRSPWLQPKLLFYLSGMGYRYDACLKILKGFTTKVIKERTAQLCDEARENNSSLSELKGPSAGRQTLRKTQLKFSDSRA